jgi:hypothetical protein
VCYGGVCEVVQGDPDLTGSADQQFLRNAQTLDGNDEVPMAGVGRMVMFVATPMVSFVIAATIARVTVVLMATDMPMWFLGILFVRLCSFDMDVGNMISRMAVPHSDAGPRSRTRIEQ